MLTLMLTLILMQVPGPDDSQATTSRAEEAQLAREEKAQDLRKPNRNPLDRVITNIEDHRLIERFQNGFHGFHPLIGRLAAGSGLAAGTSYEKGAIRTSAQLSLMGYRKYEVQFTAPKFSEHLFADFRATHRNYPQLPFYGVGRESRVEDRTSYRLRDTNYDGRFGLAAAKHVKLGVRAGWLETSAGGGTSVNQPSYVQAGAFVEVDNRDEPGNPRAGGFYAAGWTLFEDGKPGRYGFDQYDFEAQQYIPFFNDRRVIALRGRTTLTHTAPGQEIPFFMKPALGGPDDLRGYQEYRFRDNNMVVLNAEYRWEVFSGMDLALFADAGQVAAKADAINLAHFQTSYGVGFRFNAARHALMRVDVARSREGNRVFVTLGHAF